MTGNTYSLMIANQLYRDNRYQEAAAIYKRLSNLRPDFRVYQDNYNLSMKKILPVERGGMLNECTGPSTGVNVYFLQVQELALPLEELIDKVCFYVKPLGDRLQKLNFYFRPEIIPDINDNLEYLPSSLSIKKKLFFHSIDEFIGSAKQLDGAHPSILYVYNSNLTTDSSKKYNKDIIEFQKKASAWRIHDEIQHHGSFYLKSLEQYFDPVLSIERLKKLITKLRSHPNSSKCIVAGTGPSLKYVYDISSISDAIVITCNSAVYNKTLMARLQPQVVCATDPIFHAGWGKYASEFRAALLEAMRNYSFDLVVPTRDLHIYLDYLPSDLHDRICSYVLDHDQDQFNYDLMANQSVKPTPNVLTNIMLPLAASISNQISIVGCDGKKQSSGYFWEHDKSSQINKHMTDIQKQFKGFFNIDYDKYYSEHCNTLDTLLRELDKKNIYSKSMTPSYIPALVSRSKMSKQIENVISNRVDVTIIMPARNAEKTIVESIQSVLNSATYAKIRARVIVVDDGSVDNTINTVTENFSNEMGSTILIIRSSGLGVSGARNIGLGYANSHYVGFLDADDAISENSFSHRICVLEKEYKKDKNVIGSFSKTILINSVTKETISVTNDFNKTGRRYTYTDIHSPMHISSVLYRTDSLDSITFEFGLNYGEDWLFLSQVLISGGILVYEESSHSIYSINPDSATKQNPVKHLLSLFEVVNRIYSIDHKRPDAESSYYNGSIAMADKTSILAQKHAELICRIVGASVAKGTFYDGCCSVAKLGKISIIDHQTYSYMDSNKKKCADIIEKEYNRFSLGNNKGSLDNFMFGFKTFRCSNIVPELSSVISVLLSSKGAE